MRELVFAFASCFAIDWRISFMRAQVSSILCFVAFIDSRRTLYFLPVALFYYLTWNEWFYCVFLECLLIGWIEIAHLSELCWGTFSFEMSCCLLTIALVVSSTLAYYVLRYLWELLTVDNLTKKAVFITGCDSGFGRMIAMKCAQNGMPTFAGCLTEKVWGAEKFISNFEGDSSWCRWEEESKRKSGDRVCELGENII